MSDNNSGKISWKFAAATGAVAIAAFGSAAMIVVQPFKDAQHFDAVDVRCTAPGSDETLTHSFKNARVSGLDAFPQYPNAHSFTVKEKGHKAQKFDGNYCIVIPKQG